MNYNKCSMCDRPSIYFYYRESIGYRYLFGFCNEVGHNYSDAELLIYRGIKITKCAANQIYKVIAPNYGKYIKNFSLLGLKINSIIQSDKKYFIDKGCDK